MAGFLGGGGAAPGAGGGGAMGGAASPVAGATNAISGGQYSILPILNKILGLGGPPPASAPPAAAATTQAAAPGADGGSSQINTQQHQAGFHGVIPMGLQYFQNHQAKMRDAQAQTHLDALRDPSITPEQRQYHMSGLQGIYQGQPDVLSKMGFSAAPAASGGYNVPSVAGAAPAAAVSSGG